MKSTIASTLPRFALLLGALVLSATSAQSQTLTLTKEFLTESLQGDTVELQYTLVNNTGSFIQTLSFTDDFDAVITGMISLGEGINSCGGTVSGSSILSYSRSFMDPSSSCSFSVVLSIPLSAIPGTFVSTTSTVAGNVFLGPAFDDPGATASLTINPLLTFEKSFIDDPVSPGSPVILEFRISNKSTSATVSAIAFTDDLNAALTGLAATSTPLSEICTSGSLSGTGLLTFANGRLGPTESCLFQVTLTVPPGTPTGSITNTTSAISGIVDLIPYTGISASDDLKVGSPILTKTFTDDPVFPGGTTTLQFSISNVSTTDTYTDMHFTDDLTAALSGLDVNALPINGFCGGGSMLTGTTSLSLTGATLGPNSTCTFSAILNVPNDAPSGNHLNTTGSLFTTLGITVLEGEPANDFLTVVGVPMLAKSYSDDPVAPGEQVTLEFTINNFNRDDGATNISFTDDLDASLTGLVATGLPLVDPCGSGSLLTGTGLLTLSGGTMAPEGSCTFSVTLEVPVSAAAGTYPNVTSALASNVGGVPVTGGTATDSLIVDPATLITIDWSDDPVATGSTATMDITLTNSSISSAATDISFSLSFYGGLPTLNAGPLSTCDGDVLFTPRIDPLPPNDSVQARIDYGLVTPGTLAPGASCTIQIVMDVAPDIAAGKYPHTSSGVTSTVDGVTYTGPPGTDDLVVAAGPSLRMEFTDDPTLPGNTVTLQFTLTHEEQAGTDATNISFTDDLAFLAGLTANLPPAPDPPCGIGSSLIGSAGDTLLTLTGGTLTQGESCTFTVTLDVPLGATSGSHTNVSSGVSANVEGLPVISNPGTDDLKIAGLTFTKEFIGDPVIPGDVVSLRFNIENTNPSPTDDATSIFFTDNLTSVLTGLVATGPPSVNTCSGTLSGTTSISYVGGSLTIGTTCTVTVDVLVPPGAMNDTYTNITSNLTATVDGSTVVIDPATDELIVDSNLLQLTKSFTDDPVAPGDPVTLEFNLTNLDINQAASAIGFTDDLAAALPDLTFDSLLTNTCGATVTGIGTTAISVSDTSLTAAGTCTISVSLSVPATAAAGIYTNTTSTVTGTINGLPVSGDAASSNLEIVQLLLFSKSFDGPTTAPGTSTLTFTITNPGTNAAANISFSDNLDDVITGLVATSLPAQPCGAGSSLQGTSFLTFTGGELPPLGGMCSFDVNVLVPVTATAGTFPNTTSDLFHAGLSVANPATADLTVEPPPTFTKSFSPPTIIATGTSTLSFTIDNTANSLPATSLDFTDNLPAGVVIAGTPNASTTCTSASLTALAGTTALSFSGGTVPAGASCSAQVDVTSVVVGAHVNTTGDLTSSSGNSGAATDTLLVTPAADLSVTKSDGVTSATPGASLTYTIVASNAGPNPDPSMGLSDTFPSPPLTCTYTSVAAGGATGNTAAGSGNLAETLSMPAGSSVVYTATCDIDSDATGTLSNTATISPSISDTAPGNNSATDSDTVLVPSVDLGITKSDGVTTAVPGSTLEYTIVARNDGPSDDPAATVVDSFPGILDCAYTSIAAGGAAGNTASGLGDLAETLWLPAGSTVTYTATCSIDPAATGTISNTATITASAVDSLPGNNSATDADTVLVPEADLAVTKSDGVTTVVPGSVLQYTIVARNYGPSNDPAATLFDSFPGILDCTYASIATGGATSNTASGVGNLAETLWLPTGSTVTYTATCAIDSAATGTVSNTVTINPSVTDPVPENNSATDADTVLTPEADLTLSTTDSPDPVIAGNQLTYTLTVTNLGPSDAIGVVVTDSLPAGVTFSSTSGCSEDPNGLPVCNLGPIAVNQSAQYTLTIDVDSATTGVITNSATVTASTVLVTTGDDTTNEDTTVNTEADLELTKEDDLDPLPTGSNLIYTLTVINHGPSDATNVVVSDTLPAAVTLVATSGCTEDPLAAPTCSLGTISAGGSAQYDITVTTAAPPLPAMITNSASVTSDTSDPAAANNSTSEDTVLDADAPTVTLVDSVSGTGDGSLEPCETASQPIQRILVSFSEPVLDSPGDSDPDDVTNPANYRVLSPGVNASFDTVACGVVFGDDLNTAIDSVTYDNLTATASVNLIPTLAGSLYRFLVCGSTSISDLAGNALDGNADGVGGDDFSLTFRADPGNLLVNGHFDCDLDPWTLTSATPGEIEFGSDDQDGSNDSGSAHLFQLGTNSNFEVGQCIPAVGGAIFSIAGRAKIVTADFDFVSVTDRCTFFAQTGCSGANLGNGSHTQVVSGAGSWMNIGGSVTSPPGSLSAWCTFELTSPAGDDFDAWFDGLSVISVNAIYNDGFESGDTTAWSAVSGK